MSSEKMGYLLNKVGPIIQKKDILKDWQHISSGLERKQRVTF